MATSRTGTTKWITLRRKAIRQAQHAGQRTCPLCRTYLNWTASGHPDSPEADHITPHAEGGTDTLDNVRIICRQCNQRRGGQLGKQRAQQKRNSMKQQQQQVFVGALNTSQQW